MPLTRADLERTDPANLRVKATISLCCGIIRPGWRPPLEMHSGLCRDRHGGRRGETYYLSDSGLVMDDGGTMRVRERPGHAQLDDEQCP